MKSETRVGEVVKELERLYDLAVVGQNVRHAVRTQLEQLMLIRDDPNGQIMSAVRILVAVRDMDLAQFLVGAEDEITEAMRQLRLWLAEQSTEEGPPEVVDGNGVSPQSPTGLRVGVRLFALGTHGESGIVPDLTPTPPPPATDLTSPGRGYEDRKAEEGERCGEHPAILTETEQIVAAGDVSRRIRSGLAQADLRAVAGALGGDREDID